MPRAAVLAVGMAGALLPARGLALESADLGSGGCEQSAQDDPEDHEGRWEGLSIYADQDVFWPPALDQDYTMGLEFVGSGRWVRTSGLSRPLEWLDGLVRIGRVHACYRQDDVPAEATRSTSAGRGVVTHSFHFGNSAFTPAKADLGETEPIFDDRPYANLLYVKVRRSSARWDKAMVTDLTLGVLGLNVGKWVQTEIHEIRDDVIPGGWGNQISNGGEPTLKYRVSPRWRLLNTLPPAGKGAPVGLDIVASAEANVGYYTNVGAGLRARFGLLRSAWWTSERNAIADVRASKKYRGIFGGGDPFVQELYGWASGGGTLWAYNALLQGQFRDSKVTLSHDEESTAPLERLTGDWQVGATLRVKPGIGFTYGVQWLSPTFDGPKRRVHSWGSLYLTFQ